MKGEFLSRFRWVCIFRVRREQFGDEFLPKGLNLCSSTANGKQWSVDTLRCWGECFPCTQKVLLIKFLLDNRRGEGEREHERGRVKEWRQDWQSPAPFPSLSLSNRWANYCCWTQRALDRSNTHSWIQAGSHSHTNIHTHTLHCTELHWHVYVNNSRSKLVLYSSTRLIDMSNEILIKVLNIWHV